MSDEKRLEGKIPSEVHGIDELVSFSFARAKSIDTIENKEDMHEHDIEITLVIKGCGSYEIEGQQWTVYGNEVLVVPPKHVHNSNGNRQYIGNYYHIKIDLTKEFKGIGLSAEAGSELATWLFSMKPTIVSVSQHMITLVSQAYFNLWKDGYIFKCCAQAQLAEFLFLLYAQYMTMPEKQDMDFKENVERFMEENLNECYSIEEIAKQLGYSISYFKTKFRKTFGMTPNHYILSKKIEVGKKMLAQNYTITSVAMELGFSSSNYFSTVFRHFTSMTPTQYKRYIEGIKESQPGQARPDKEEV